MSEIHVFSFFLQIIGGLILFEDFLKKIVIQTKFIVHKCAKYDIICKAFKHGMDFQGEYSSQNVYTYYIIAELKRDFKMRMRKKKHSSERIEACSEFLIRDPLSCYDNRSAVFGKNMPMLLEIGCGKGDFATGISRKFADHGIIAIERVPDVAMLALEKAAATAQDRPDNLRFIIGHAQYLSDWFRPHSFERIYVNFCDPWPKTGYHKRRLTAPSFLKVYRSLLVPGGELHFKTDNEPLFDWSLEQFESEGLETVFVTRDLHSSELARSNVMTEYEKHFSSMGMNIFSAHVRFPETVEDAAPADAPEGDK